MFYYKKAKTMDDDPFDPNERFGERVEFGKRPLFGVDEAAQSPGTVKASLEEQRLGKDVYGDQFKDDLIGIAESFNTFVKSHDIAKLLEQGKTIVEFHSQQAPYLELPAAAPNMQGFDRPRDIGEALKVFSGSTDFTYEEPKPILFMIN